MESSKMRGWTVRGGVTSTPLRCVTVRAVTRIAELRKSTPLLYVADRTLLGGSAPASALWARRPLKQADTPCRPRSAWVPPAAESGKNEYTTKGGFGKRLAKFGGASFGATAGIACRRRQSRRRLSVESPLPNPLGQEAVVLPPDISTHRMTQHSAFSDCCTS